MAAPKDGDDSRQQPDPRDMIAILGSAQAPVIFCDDVTMFGASGSGVTGFTLEAYRSMVLPSGPHTDRVAVAHIRLTEEAVRSLRTALQQLEARPAEAVGPIIPTKTRAH